MLVKIAKLNKQQTSSFHLPDRVVVAPPGALKQLIDGSTHGTINGTKQRHVPVQILGGNAAPCSVLLLDEAVEVVDRVQIIEAFLLQINIININNFTIIQCFLRAVAPETIAKQHRALADVASKCFF